MRLLFLLFCSLISTHLFSQLLIPEEEWFNLNSFFNEEQIVKHKIWHIQIESQDKKDGALIRENHDRIDYYFIKNGLLEYSSKVLRYSSILDSSHLYLYYNPSQLISKKREKQGYFDFSFIYEYHGDKVVSEIKIDSKNQRDDTLYHRHFKHEKMGNKKVKHGFNEAGVEFMKVELIKSDEIIEKRVSYTRTGLYQSTLWYYENTLLSQKTHTNYSGGKKEEVWHYYYKNNLLEEVFQFDEEGNKKIRMAILRNKESLPINIIERNYPLKSVRIYKLKYEFY